MKNILFISLRDDDAIARFAIDNGVVENRLDFKIEGGPGPMLINAEKTHLFVGLRKSNELVCLKMGEKADLSLVAKTPLPTDPCFLGLDRKEEYIFSTYYGGGQIAVHQWDKKEARLTETQRIITEKNAHSVWIEPTNSYVYVPHTGPNKIYLYNFNQNTGTLQSRTPPWFSYTDHLEPRHLCFHPTRNIFYAANEGSSTLSVFSYNRENGNIDIIQTVSTLPDSLIENNKVAEIRIAPDGRHVFVSNRGHDSICSFNINENNGSVEFKSWVSVPAVPRSFDISLDGRFLYTAGQDSGELAVFTIDANTGMLKEISRDFIGHCPLWVMSAL